MDTADRFRMLFVRVESVSHHTIGQYLVATPSQDLAVAFIPQQSLFLFLRNFSQSPSQLDALDCVEPPRPLPSSPRSPSTTNRVSSIPSMGHLSCNPLGFLLNFVSQFVRSNHGIPFVEGNNSKLHRCLYPIARDSWQSRAPKFFVGMFERRVMRVLYIFDGSGADRFGLQ